MGKPCVCGADSLNVNIHAGQFTVDGHTISEGDVHLDRRYERECLPRRGARPAILRPAVFRGHGLPRLRATRRGHPPILGHADQRRVMHVRANADTGEAAHALRFGAQGIGLCRTEHMFLGPRREVVERLILAGTDAERQQHWRNCCRYSATTSSRFSRRWTDYQSPYG